MSGTLKRRETPEDPRDIYELCANQGARRLRACILATIPGDVSEAAERQCAETIKARFDVTPERINNLLESFGEFGVSREQIEARIQRRLDAIQPAHLLQLGRILESLKDGMGVVADFFHPAEAASDGKASREDQLMAKLVADAKESAEMVDRVKLKREAKPKTKATKSSEQTVNACACGSANLSKINPEGFRIEPGEFWDGDYICNACMMVVPRVR